MRELDLFIDIPNGTTLIEAAAGAGKTYSVVALYLRLILERELPVESILVVTFTEAATQELRERIRVKLSSALDAFSDSKSDDPFLAALVERTADKTGAQRLLISALGSFDGAAIHTIHGFCARVLKEHAFECGALFDTELVTDQSPVINESSEDFWRNHIYTADRFFVGFALCKGFTPGIQAKLLRQAIGKIDPIVVPEVSQIPHDKALEDCLVAFGTTADSWRLYRVEVEQILIESDSLSRVLYKRESIPAWMNEMDRYLNAIDPLDSPDKFNKFTSAGVSQGTKKKAPPPSHRFFLICDELQAKKEVLENIFDNNLLALKGELVKTARHELARRKERRNIRSYDDLLYSLDEALRSDNGGLLAERLRRRFQAALVDEFQDTDPLQYSIFTRLFAGSGFPLFLIGDPKQAIYSFRGADLYAYLAAAQRVEQGNGYTLTRNRRSTPGLLSAINGLFADTRPFFIPEIEYRPVSAGSEEQRQTLFPDKPPFVVWSFGSEEGTLSKGNAEQLVSEAVACEIARLLSAGERGEALINGKALIAGDIAVLVRTNYQGRMIRNALRNIGIPGVLHGTESLFKSQEAMEFCRVLFAVVDPGNSGLLRAALATSIFGRSAGEIAALKDENDTWTDILERFRGYHDIWAMKGVMAMAAEVIAVEEVRPRLAGHVDGERRLTNLFHLLELLHHTELEEGLGMERLVAWLSERIVEPPEMDEYQLRLETDEGCVRIVTVHRSKGLEYPVVFCPFAWEEVKEGETTFFHDGERLLLDLGSVDIEANRVRAKEESFAEDLRLLYVALTRAKERCYLVWGDFRVSERSALAYLLRRPGREETSGMGQSLQRLVDEAAGAICVETPGFEIVQPVVTPDGAASGLSPRMFNRNIDRSRRVTSFTGLVSTRQQSVESPDRDSTEFSPVEQIDWPPPVTTGIIGFPRGSQAGSCLHAVLEKVDFSEYNKEKVGRQARDQLIRHGIDPSRESDVVRMVELLSQTPLNDRLEDIRLADISSGNRVPEMEFMLPLAPLQSGDLAKVFRDHGKSDRFPALLETLGFSRVHGMLRGFIDLVFSSNDRYYLIDWKSNYLGPNKEDYSESRLWEVMDNDFYTLQYHIYSVALHRYLSLRIKEYDYDRHFGGAFYIFLRGIGDNAGVYFDKPKKALMEALSELFTSADKHSIHPVGAGSPRPNSPRPNSLRPKTPPPLPPSRNETQGGETPPLQNLLDRAFASFICRLAKTDSQALWLAAALTSNAAGKGSICLDLESVSGSSTIMATFKEPLLKDAGLWCEELRRFSTIASPGGFAPLILDDKKRLYLHRYWICEKEIAEALLRKAAKIRDDIDENLLREGLERLFPSDDFADEPDWQRFAAWLAVTRSLTIITGGPGTGKTSTVVKILELLIEQAGENSLRIALAAPTGKAAGRLKEAVAISSFPSEATTLHRLLGIAPGYPLPRYNRKNLLPYDLVVVDEASMVDIPLAAKLLDALHEECRLILLGDCNQLASVEAGALLGDIGNPAMLEIFSPECREASKRVAGISLPQKTDAVPTPLGDSLTALQKGRRFGSASGIALLSKLVNEGRGEEALQLIQEGNHPDIVWHDLPSQKEFAARLKKRLMEGYIGYLSEDDPYSSLENFAAFRVLSPLRKGPYGVQTVNIIAEQALGVGAGARYHTSSEWYHRRPILITANDNQLHLFNGDIGIILKEEKGEGYKVWFQSPDGGLRHLSPFHLPQHETAFSMTVHKSQGSEFDSVLLLLPDANPELLTRELVYTAITRAGKRIEIWGTPEAFIGAVSRRLKRSSGLAERLWKG